MHGTKKMIGWLDQPIIPGKKRNSKGEVFSVLSVFSRQSLQP